MNLSPLPIQKFFDNNGRPLVGGLLFTYAAGTATKIATYTDDAGGTPNTNPIVLDYRGEARVWLDQALTYKFVLSPEGDTDPPTKPIWTVDKISAAITYASLTAQIIGQALWRKSSAEAAAGITPSDYGYQWLDPRRYNNNWTTWNAVQAAATTAPEQVDNFHWNRSEPTSFGLGKNALIASSGIENFAIGEDALKSQTTGVANLAIGFSSCPLLTTGSFTTAVGTNTMLFYTNGVGFNTVYGYGSYARGLDGSNNVAMGFETIHDNKSGNQNVAIGSAALRSGSNGVSPTPSDPSNCVAVGNEALRFCYQSANTAIGFGAMRGDAAFSSAQESVAVGSQSLNVVTSGSSNTTVGYQTGMAITTSSENTVVGNQAGKTLTTGGQNVAIGRFSLFYNATCTQNTFLGTYAGFGLVGNAGGGQNVGIGFQSMDTHNSSATNTVAVGMNTLRGVTGANNTAIGHSAGNAVTSGSFNALGGYQSGLILTTGASNACWGQQSGAGLTTGGSNVLIGAVAGSSISTGSNNTAVGTGAGTSNGTNRTSVGFNAQCIADNTITLGDTNVIQIRAQVTTITAISDARFKKGIRPLDIPDAFLDEVEICCYEWIQDDMPAGVQVGVIAQNLDALQTKYGVEWLGLVDKTNPNRWEATPGKLLFPLITRAQRLAREVRDLAKRVGALEA